MVKVEATGDKRIVSVEIDEDVLNPEDKDMIQDTIVAAINDVMRKIDEETQDVMGAFTGGMPGFF
jgi:DNA-binding YbaB/EbfC family protein